MAMLEINDLTREFTRRGARFAAVDHVSFSMDQGELVAIIGRSGNGKSTLLNLIAGLLKPTSGTVEIDGRNVSKLSDKELSQLRNATLGFVTQGQTLLGNLTVLDNVILPAVLFGPAKKTVVPDDVAAPGEADAAGAADSAREQDDADMPDVIDDDLTAEHEPDALERRATMLLDRLGVADRQLSQGAVGWRDAQCLHRPGAHERAEAADPRRADRRSRRDEHHDGHASAAQRRR